MTQQNYPDKISNLQPLPRHRLPSLAYQNIYWCIIYGHIILKTLLLYVKRRKKKCQVCSQEFLVNVGFSYNFSSASTHPILKCLFNKGNKEHNTKGDHIRHWVHRTAYQTIKGNEFLLIDKLNIMIISCHKS